MLASAAINLRSSSASRAFSKALPNSTAAPFSLVRTLSRFSVRSMADSAAAPFKKIQIHRGDTAFDAYVVGKEDAPGIVVLQEWWGVDFEIKNHAMKISQLAPGFKALIPDLYRGKVGLDVAEAQHLMDGLDWQGAVKDIQASANWLKANGSKKVSVLLDFVWGVLSQLQVLFWSLRLMLLLHFTEYRHQSLQTLPKLRLLFRLILESLIIMLASQMWGLPSLWKKS
ncbi:hypothetical protein PRUPE_3G214600 [Prunus persica]|uniref:Dienelactone hydrolase domain-containing protein n=1 Tax=Prunus persica TaxID=3760 RepID=A0A251Q3V0_PRUPE|nr:hypothetical protein PRUPE_3G214600 [Prunus persica]